MSLPDLPLPEALTRALVASTAGSILGSIAGGLFLGLLGGRLRRRRHTLAGFVPLIDLPNGARVPDAGPLARRLHSDYTGEAMRALGHQQADEYEAEDIAGAALDLNGWASPDCELFDATTHEQGDAHA